MTEEVDDDLVEEVREVFRMEMKASEKMNNIDKGWSDEEVVLAIDSVSDSLLQKAEDPVLEQKVYTLVYRFGQLIGSEGLAVKGKEGLEAIKEQHE